VAGKMPNIIEADEKDEKCTGSRPTVDGSRKI